MPNDQQLLFSVDNSIACITLNRPEAHNALSRSMWEGLPLLFRKAKDSGARVVVITGSGSSFASGADLLELEKIDSYAAAREQWLSIKNCLEFIWSFELPSMAMVNGACLGGGCLLALACDLRIASRRSSFGIPVARLGIVLDDDNIARLVNLVGAGAAAELLYLADTISSGKAEMLGLVNQVVEPEALAEVVQLQAQRLASNAALTISQAKASIIRALGRRDGSSNQEAVLQSYLGEEFKDRIHRQLKT